MPNIAAISSVTTSGAQIEVFAGTVEAETVDQIEIELIADDSEVIANILPDATSELHLLLLSSSHYSPHLSYVFSDGFVDTLGTLPLDKPQMFSAPNLDRVCIKPTQIKFTMGAAGEAATVSIFVLRKPIPPPPVYY